MQGTRLCMDQILARDKATMPQEKAELQDFLKNHSINYIEQWLQIWTPYFHQGVKIATCKSFEQVWPLTTYFTKKTTARTLLL
eukprot:2087901-Ditylum_brightwellii.AAC.1